MSSKIHIKETLLRSSKRFTQVFTFFTFRNNNTFAVSFLKYFVTHHNIIFHPTTQIGEAVEHIMA